MVSKVTEDNVIELFGSYALEHHSELLAATGLHCPFHSDDPDVSLFFVSTWALFNAIIPSTGLGINEEFARRYIDDPILAAKMRRANTLTIDAYNVMTAHKDGRYTVRSTTTNKIYDVIPAGPLVNSCLSVGSTKMCMMHPWEADGTHMMAGVMDVEMNDLDLHTPLDEISGASMRANRNNTRRPSVPWFDSETVMNHLSKEWKEDAESIKITPRSKIAPALKKYPGAWSKAICMHIGIRPASRHQDRSKDISNVLTMNKISDVLLMLSDDQLDCLKYVAASGGIVKFSKLEKYFGPDDSDYYWRESVRSIIGVLRRTGILIVGTQTVNSRNYKVGAIAADVLNNLKRRGFTDDVPDADALVAKAKTRQDSFGETRADKPDTGKSRFKWRRPKWLTRNRIKST